MRPLLLLLAAAAAAAARPVARRLPSRPVDPITTLTISQYAVPLTYDAPLLNQWGFEPAPCAVRPFLTARTGMATGWICATDGERRVLRAMDAILRAGCSGGRDGGASPPLVLDVGSNSGFYGLNAAAHGCSVAFFDAQPGCQKVVAASILVNAYGARAVVVGGGLSDAPGTLRADSNGTCAFASGRFPMAQLETGTLDRGDVDVPLLPLTRLLPATTPILLVKVDTEGNEQRVLAGMLPFFEARSIQHAVVEVTAGYGFWERQGIRPADVAATMAAIVRHGYTFTKLAAEGGERAVGADPEAVRALFAARGFNQTDFLVSRV